MPFGAGRRGLRPEITDATIRLARLRPRQVPGSSVPDVGVTAKTWAARRHPGVPARATGRWSARSPTSPPASLALPRPGPVPADGGGAAGPLYHEHGELQFRRPSWPGQPQRADPPRRPDGAADVRFADGRAFYGLDLRSGAWQADHPCRRDSYHVTVTRLGPDSFTERWRVGRAGKGLRAGHDLSRISIPIAAASGIDPQARRDRAGCRTAAMSSAEYAGTIPRLLAAAAERDRTAPGCAATTAS